MAGPFPLSMIGDPGGHFEAYDNQRRLYEAVLATARNKGSALEVLDFGCGRLGVSRVILQYLMHTRDRLHLYDPAALIESPRDANVRVASEEEIFGPQRTRFDVMTLSYVLCCVPPRDVFELLKRLKTAQPQARGVFVDYTLADRSETEVLRFLNAQEERSWLEKLGRDEFIAVHRRFSRDSLERLLSSHFHVMGHAAPLDKQGVRAAAVTLPNQSLTDSRAKSHMPIHCPIAAQDWSRTTRLT
ncbi:MAG: methyltransferase domain-containing protein [Candidatus Peregrinibacteria bacterium]